MIERIVVLVGVIGLALAVLALLERVRPRGAFAPGITVVTGPDCRLCGPLLTSLDLAGAEYSVMDATRDRLPVPVRSLPTVFVADRTGAVAFRRSGRSAIHDIQAILATAAGEERAP